MCCFWVPIVILTHASAWMPRGNVYHKFPIVILEKGKPFR